MRADGVAETLRRGATAARGVFARCCGVGDDRHRIHSGGVGPSAQPEARRREASVAFMERRLRRDVLVPKVLGAQVALAAVLVHVMRGGLDFLIASSEEDHGASLAAWSWSRSARDSTGRETRALAPGPTPFVAILPALGFAFVAAATLRARGSRLLRAWRIAQLACAAIAIAYAHAVCVAARAVPELAEVEKDAAPAITTEEEDDEASLDLVEDYTYVNPFDVHRFWNREVFVTPPGEQCARWQLRRVRLATEVATGFPFLLHGVPAPLESPIP